MYKKIILAYDGSSEGLDNLTAGLNFDSWNPTNVYVLAIVPLNLIAIDHETPYFNNENEEFDNVIYRSVLSEAVQRITAFNRITQGELVKGDPIDQIVNLAKRVDADLIIVSHKPQENWLKRWWSNSLSKALIEHSPCSILMSVEKYK